MSIKVTMVTALVCSLGFASHALAQVCGDADGNGSVTVADGVQVLRSAAELTSTCTDRPNNCDIDGNGSVSLADGVNALRKAAELPITEACPGGNGEVGDAQEVVDDFFPFLVPPRACSRRAARRTARTAARAPPIRRATRSRSPSTRAA
jgi:hypothetical protein